MSIHISAKFGEISETVIICGDPLRAKFIAKNFLDDVVLVNEIRNMLGYTGTTFDGKKISVMGTGIGMASTSIYVNELINFYGVKKIIRVGSTGSMQESIGCRSVIMALGSCSDSAINISKFLPGVIYAPLADPELLFKAYEISIKLGIKIHVGNVFATDNFYGSNAWKKLAKYGVLAVEMETAELYTLAAKYKIQALTILTVSDNLITKEELTSNEREKTLLDMIQIALRLCNC